MSISRVRVVTVQDLCPPHRSIGCTIMRLYAGRLEKIECSACDEGKVEFGLQGQAVDLQRYDDRPPVRLVYGG